MFQLAVFSQDGLLLTNDLFTDIYPTEGQFHPTLLAVVQSITHIDTDWIIVRL